MTVQDITDTVLSKGTGKSFAGKRRASALLALQREHQVAQLMLKGYSNLEISLRSEIPFKKVYSYVRRVRERAEGIVIQDASVHHAQALRDLREVANHSLAEMNDSKQGWCWAGKAVESLKAIATMTGPKESAQALSASFVASLPAPGQVKLGGVIEAPV